MKRFLSALKYTFIGITIGIAGCAAVKTVARTVNDAAAILCVNSAQQMAGSPQLQGLSAEDWCGIAENLAPFIEAATSAQQTASQQAGLEQPKAD